MIGLNNFYISNTGLLILIATVGVLIIAVAHYLIIGPHGKRLGELEPEIQRLNYLEILAHFIRMVSFVLLAITGVAFALYKNMGFSYQFLLHIHLFFGVLFALASLVSIVVWIKDNTFKSYDWEWFKVMGGYLSKNETHAPAGRFNAGQKLFYWCSTILSILIIYTGYILAYPAQSATSKVLSAALIHGISAIILIAMVIGHAYLGSLANPGTFGVIIHGRVAKEWVKLHHPKLSD